MNNHSQVPRAELNKLFLKAGKLFRQGRMGKAKTLLQKIVAIRPSHPDAHHLLGIIAAEQGQYKAAEKCITLALNINPDNAIFQLNLGRVLHKKGCLDEALAACERSIQLKPQFAEAHNYCGYILMEMGRTEEALTACEQAIRFNHEYAEAHCTRGVLLRDLHRPAEAVAALEHSIHLKPLSAEAHNNLGNALRDLCSLDSLDAYQQAIRLNPKLVEAHSNLGKVLSDLGRLEAAEESCCRALRLKSDHVEALVNLGAILQKAGRISEAEDYLRQAISLQPEHAEAHTSLLFLLAARSKLQPDEMLMELRHWDKVHGKRGRLHSLPARAPATSKRRLRVGYVSPDFLTHAVSYFFEPLLAAHNRNQFEIFCYASHKRPLSDSTTERLRMRAEHWRFVDTESDEDLAKLIHSDGIDMLVDLAGHTSGHRLKAFTYRPAPVQVAYLGFFASSGLEAMDYWITDDILHPMDTLEQSTEIIYRLPRCWTCYQPPADAPEVAPCPNNDDRVVFGCFSNLSKLTPEVIETWSHLLHRLPFSRLLIMDKHIADSKTRQRLIGQFERHHIPPERLILREGAQFQEYLETYGDVDIVLDPFPRTGGTTTAEALWMGVPVITLAGDRYVERISASKLTAVQLEDFITGNPEDYIEKAISLALDTTRRMELREQLRSRMQQSPLCDSENFAHAIESTYLSIWESYLSKNRFSQAE